MTSVMETIVSDDELSPDRHDDDELDFEEDDIHNTDDKDEGELDDDEDLEEGEVKEDDDDDHRQEPQSRPEPQTSARQNSICRFYGRGQCTWGNNCRFVHPTGGVVKRLPPPPPPPPMAMPPMPNRRTREWQEPNSESAWERGLKQAKEMIVRASRRKEEEIDFEDKRFNLSQDDNDREQSPHRDDRYDEEYERRRRLAFESAPWNNEEPPGARLRQAETYRDPWRRSKSPPVSAGKGRRPPMAGSRSGSKRSHSMSSISASGSESSDFSGSEGSESFSESTASNASGRSGGGRRLNRKTVSEKKTSEQRFAKKALANNWNKETKENYDSWSESLSDSDSISSYYSESTDEKRIPKRAQKHKKTDDSLTTTPPVAKKPKVALRVSPKKDEPKKSPIKMTFMKKKKENFNPSLAFKANNGRDVIEDELLAEDDTSLSPKVESNSPVSQESPTPGLQATFSRREELLQQLKAVEDAIARKRSKIN